MNEGQAGFSISTVGVKGGAKLNEAIHFMAPLVVKYSPEYNIVPIILNHAGTMLARS